MKILYIAPDVPVPHTGEFLGGPTHVLRWRRAEKGCDVFIVSRRMRGQRKCEKYSEELQTILRMRLTCMRVERCLRRMGGGHRLGE